MYGLEKKPKHVFEFDLEKDLKKDPNKVRELLKTTEAKIHEIKTQLREGAKGPELDQLGVLLHGYTALQKVLSRLANKK
ncbi:MAG: DUF5398 family protein [Rhabdochlamydiaceae bacterium]